MGKQSVDFVDHGGRGSKFEFLMLERERRRRKFMTIEVGKMY